MQASKGTLTLMSTYFFPEADGTPCTMPDHPNRFLLPFERHLRGQSGKAASSAKGGAAAKKSPSASTGGSATEEGSENSPEAAHKGGDSLGILNSG